MYQVLLRRSSRLEGGVERPRTRQNETEHPNMAPEQTRTRQKKRKPAKLIHLSVYFGAKMLHCSFWRLQVWKNVREGSRCEFSLPDLCLSAEFHQYETFVVCSFKYQCPSVSSIYLLNLTPSPEMHSVDGKICILLLAIWSTSITHNYISLSPPSRLPPPSQKKIAKRLRMAQVYDQIFMGAGVVDGEGGNSERCLKWGNGVIKESFQKHLKKGVGKGKSCS